MKAIAYVSWGLWVAKCPRPGCPNNEHYGPHPETGHVGGLTGRGFACSHCGLVCAVEWPPNVDDIMRLLMMRPVPATRNWQPGEDLHDLLQGNMVNGCVPAPLDVGTQIDVAGHHGDWLVHNGSGRHGLQRYSEQPEGRDGSSESGQQRPAHTFPLPGRR